MAITAEARTDIIALVVGMFDAAPGATYLSQFVNAADAGATIETLAADLTGTGAFKGIYPDLQTNNEFATKFVNNIASEASDSAKAWAVTWIEAQLNGGATKAEVIVASINALRATDEADANWGNAAAALNNKVEVAEWYSVDQLGNAVDLATLQDTVSTVTSDDTTVTDITSGSAQSGEEFALTTGVDEVIGTSFNDTITANSDADNNATLTALDDIDGGAGTDTLIIRDTNAAEGAEVPASADVTGVEVVDFTTAGDLTANVTGWTGLNTVIADVTGIADIDAGDVAATVETTGTADVLINDGSVELTAGEGATVTINDGSVDVTAGGDAVVTAADATSIAVAFDAEDTTSTANITADSATSVSITGGVANDGETSVDVDNLGAISIIGNVDEGEDAEDAADDSFVAQTLNVNTVDNTALNVTIAGDVTLTSADTDAEADAEDADLTAVNLTINATTLASSLDLTSTTVTDVTVSGAGDVDLTVETDTVTDVDASALTGDISVSIAGDTMNYAGGAGVDTVTLTALPAEDAEDATVFGTVVDGGAGDADVVALDGGLAATAADIAEGAAFTTAVSGFEVLSITDLDADDIDATTFGINSVKLDASLAAEATGASVTIADAGSIEVLGALTDVAIVIDGAAEDIAAEDTTAADYSLNLTVTGDAEGIDAGEVTVANTGTLNIETDGTANAEGDVEAANVLDLVAVDATVLNITGDAALDMSGASTLTALETVDASAFDAGLTIDVSSAEAADGEDTVGVAITTGAGVDDITGSDLADTISTGAGNDVVDAGAGDDTITTGAGENSITGGTGQDTINLSDSAELDAEDAAIADTLVYATVADSQGVTVDVINGFQVDVVAGQDAEGEDVLLNDVINLTAVDTTGAYLGEANGYGAVLTSLSGGLTTEAVLDTSTSTLYVDVDGSGTLDDADMAIQLTGITDLSDANFAFTAA